MDNNIPIVVFNLLHDGNIRRALAGEPVGTYIGRD
jgi:uridylate kinase